MSFNLKQQEALNLGISENALVAAAAGSGKTRVLSTRVFNLINEKKIKPSELLVLTFTNNAAFEMKTRIIDTFNKAKMTDLALEMKSSHIQTFDSFSQYLVNKYSGFLGISDTYSIIDESIIDLKRKIFLDEIIDEYYDKDFDRIVNVFKKYSSSNDNQIKAIILDIDSKLNKLTDSDKNNYINNYEKLFLSKDKFNEYYDDYINYFKDIIIYTIFKTNFYDRNYDYIKDNDIEEFEGLLNKKSEFEKDYRLLSYSYGITNDVYQSILKILKLNGSEFVSSVKSANGDELFNTLKAKNKEICTTDKDENKYFIGIHNELCNLFQKNGNKNPQLLELLNLEDEEELYNKYFKFKDDILFIFEIIKKLDSRVLDYKKKVNSFTFFDIANFTNMLLTDSKYASIQDEIRSQFKYIMVDEYQDSNDFQEALIDSLLKPDKNGNCAHLFCVGDVKQSIYAFRNSNVELFKNRQDKYRSGSDGRVIDMNFNYRSGKKLLHDINYLFEKYMTLDNGDIDYSNTLEQLHYDDEVDLYKEAYDEFGVHRIISHIPTSRDWEAYAILSDIKRKIEDGFKVYEKGVGIRNCRYSDFAIITRTKSGFELYQKLFYENGIPINNKVTVVLTDIDVIITLESLFTLIEARMKYNKSADIKHLFASLARSYIYEYSDNDIENILREKSYDKLNNDKIMKEIDSFVETHKFASFDTIFLDALCDFKIIEKLNLVGNVSDNMGKIEALFKLVLNEKNAGEGISDFVELFKTITKNKLDLKDETNTNIENAVDMMTIHASKGLERKIIYLPQSYNSAGGIPGEKPDYTFSKDYGIILKDYDINEDKTPHCITSILHKLNEINSTEKKVDDDEFVRLMYVAFTRAENICYVVGNCADNKKKNIYDIYKCLPSYYYSKVEFLEKKIDEGILDKSLVRSYYDSIDNIKKLGSGINLSEIDKNNVKLYKELYNEKYYNLVYDYHNAVVEEMDKSLYQSYKHKMDLFLEDKDYLARLYAIYHSRPNINSFDDLYSDLLRSIENEDDEEEGISDSYGINLMMAPSEEVLYEHIKNFGDIIYNEKIDVLGIKLVKDEEKNNIRRRNLILPLYIELFDNEREYKIKSYELNGFKDKKIYPDFTNLKFEKKDEPELPKLDISNTKLEFNKRIKQRASISTMKDKDIEKELEYGIYLHHMFELIDFKNIDTSFIKDKKAKGYIDNVLKLDLFKSLDKCDIYKEYGYYDEDFDTTGFIDLMYIKDGIYYIIDYKTSDISKPGYVLQLSTYRRNIMNIFNVDKSKIRLFLVSILNCEVKEIITED